jgi:hypothetical protein
METNITYKPLSDAREIRVLVVHRGEWADEIKCTLQHVALDSGPSFEAISYAWGDANIRETVTVGGQQASITVSLYTALRQFRYTDQDRTLWADAVCIKQMDKPEKSIQVQLMAEIYRHATKVLIWLGANTDGLDDLEATLSKAHKLVVEMGLEVDPTAKEKTVGGDMEAAQQDNAKHLGLLDFEWGPIPRLFSRPWFQRKWVIQEVALARDIGMYCGGIIIPFKSLGDVIISIGNSAILQFMPQLWGIETSRSFSNAAMIYQFSFAISNQRLDGMKINQLINETRLFQCGDDRDQLFTLYNLLGDKSATDSLPKPDYVSNATEVYRRFAVWNLIDQQDPDILSLRSSPLPNLPSWAPNLAGLSPDENMLVGDDDIVFSAGGTSPLDIRLSGDGKIIECQAKVVDTVSELVAPLTQLPMPSIPEDLDLRGQPEDRVKVVLREKSWLKLLEGLAAKGENATTENGKLTEERFDEFWRTLMCGAHRHRGAAEPATDSVGKVFADFMEYIYTLLDGHNPEWYHEKMHSAFIIEPSLSMYAMQKAFCLTSQGRLALVSRSAQKGDKICVIAGAGVPYTIHPVEGTANHELIGEAYYHSLMNGEAFGREDLKVQTITLE